jgi:hypothetical protein
MVHRAYVEKAHHKKGLVEWLKVKALSSSPSTKTKKRKRNTGKMMALEERLL